MNTTAIYRVLKRLAKKRGIILIEAAPLPSMIYGLWYYPKCFESISLNKALRCPERRAFTLAHELGHSILHRNTIDTALYWKDPGYTLSIEREADAYAERLLSRLRSA